MFKYIEGEKKLEEKLSNLVNELNNKEIQKENYRNNYTIGQLWVLVRKHGYRRGVLNLDNLIDILISLPKRQNKNKKGRPSKDYNNII